MEQNQEMDTLGLQDTQAQDPENEVPSPDVPSENAAQPEQEEEFPSYLSDALMKLKDICELEDTQIRQLQLQKLARLEYYFQNLVTIFWDAAGGGWRIPDWDNMQLEDDDNVIPPRVMAIYRAYAETIIAALSVDVPSIVFFPDDAEDILDIETASEMSAISALIQRHLDSPVLFAKIATIIFNHGTVFGYSYYKRDSKFGQLLKPTVSTLEVPLYVQNCSSCGYEASTSYEPIPVITCPQCGKTGPTDQDQTTDQMEVHDYEKIDKGRILVDLYDPRFVKVSFYARSQEHVGYLHLTFDQNIALLRNVFNDLTINANTYDTDDNNAWARYATSYLGSTPENTAVVKCCWYRPFMYTFLGTDMEMEIKELKSRFPDGCYVIFINGKFMEAVNENMDNHWTISKNLTSQYIFSEPLGTNLATVQDVTAELDDLKLQTVEHGIPETYVKAGVIDLDAYKEGESRPGMLTPTMEGGSSGSLSESFYANKPATLSKELENYGSDLENRAQFVSGSFPSLYGGPSEGSGGTAAEYRMQRAQAMQRLGLPWKTMSRFWCDLMTKSAVEFVDNMVVDEKYVIKQGGNFKNVSISKGKLRGRISHTEAEFSDQLPVTWEQINQVVTTLMQQKNPTIDSVLFHPENAEFMKKAVGLHGVFIPNESDRNKQEYEFQLLSQQAPIGDQPSIMTDPSDNDEAQAEVLREILTSTRGIHLKENFPEGYQNCQLHLQMHEMKIQQKMASQQQPVKEGGAQ
jgi:hypothetical protein